MWLLFGRMSGFFSLLSSGAWCSRPPTFMTGQPWSLTVDHGSSRSTMVVHGRPWSLTVDHGSSR